MEARKKCNPFLICLTILMCILLALCCWVSAGAESFLPAGLRYGVRLVTDDSKTGALCAGDFVLTDRDGAVEKGAVVRVRQNGTPVYLAVSAVEDGQITLTDGATADETVVLVRYKLTFLRRPVLLLREYPWAAYGLTAAFAGLLILMKATGGVRYRKRQQALIRESFVRYGEQYAKEEEDVNY